MRFFLIFLFAISFAANAHAQNQHDYGRVTLEAFARIQKASVLGRLGFIVSPDLEITDVLPESPFGDNLQAGDRIITVNGVKIPKLFKLVFVAQDLNYQAVKTIMVGIDRGGQSLEFPAQNKSGIPLSMQFGTSVADIPAAGLVALTEASKAGAKQERITNLMLAHPDVSDQIAAATGLLAKLPQFKSSASVSENEKLLIGVQKLGVFAKLGFQALEKDGKLVVHAVDASSRFSGLEGGDEIEGLAGIPISTMRSLLSAAGDLAKDSFYDPKRQVDLTVRRGGALVTIKARSGNAPLGATFGNSVTNIPTNQSEVFGIAEKAWETRNPYPLANALLNNWNEEWARRFTGELFALRDGRPRFDAGPAKPGEAVSADSASQATAKRDDPALAISVMPQIGHASRPDVLEYSPDGNFLASGGIDNTIMLWNTRTGELLRAFRGHRGIITGIAFSPDGILLATSSEDASVIIWELASGEVRARITGASYDWAYFTAVSFSRDGTVLVTGDQAGALQGWHVVQTLLTKAGKRIYQRDTGSLHPVLQIVPQNGTASLLQAIHEFGVVTRVSGADVSSGPLKDQITSASTISANGRFALVRETLESSRFVLWDVGAKKELATFAGDEKAYNHAVAISGDEKTVAFGPIGGKIEVHAIATGKLVQSFPVSNELNLAAIRYSPDNTRLAIVQSEGAIRIVEIASAKRLIDLAGAGTNGTISLTDDGQTVLSANFDAAVLWDLESNRRLSVIKPQKDKLGTANAFLSPDGKRIVSGIFGGAETPIQAITAATGVKEGDLGIKGFAVRTIAFAPTGDLAFLPGGNGRGYFLDLKKRKLLTTIGKEGERRIWAAAYSPDGKVVATGASDEGARLRILSSPDGKIIGEMKYNQLPGGPLPIQQLISGIGFSPDSTRLVTADWDGVVALWDWKAGIQLAHSFIGASADGAGYLDADRIYATGWDGTVRIYGPKLGKPLMELSGHEGTPKIVRLANEGKHIVVVTDNGTIKHWDSASGVLLATTLHYPDGEWVRVTPEGFFDGTIAGGKRLVLVSGLESFTIDQAFQTLFRPDLVAAKLAGDAGNAVAKAAAELDLKSFFASGNAPVVTLDKTDDITTGEGSFPVTASVQARNGGMGKAEIRVNGVVQKVIETAQAQISDVVELEPGENQIEIVAFNKANTVSSRPATLRVTSTRSEPRQAPVLYVLAVGINAYADQALRLSFAVNDAKALAETLKTSAKGRFSKVEVKFVLDSEATTAGIGAAFADLASRVTARDVFVFYAASHGRTIDGRYYMIPQEFRFSGDASVLAGGISQDTLAGWLSTIRARRSALLYDTCESAGLANTVASPLSGLERITAVTRMTQSLGRTVLSAATGDAFEGIDGHGVFTYALMDAFRKGDLDRNGVITVGELASHIETEVPGLVRKVFKVEQVPQVSVFGDVFDLGNRMAR